MATITQPHIVTTDGSKHRFELNERGLTDSYLLSRFRLDFREKNPIQSLCLPYTGFVEWHSTSGLPRYERIEEIYIDSISKELMVHNNDLKKLKIFNSANSEIFVHIENNPNIEELYFPKNMVVNAVYVDAPVYYNFKNEFDKLIFSDGSIGLIIKY